MKMEDPSVENYLLPLLRQIIPQDYFSRVGQASSVDTSIPSRGECILFCLEYHRMPNLVFLALATFRMMWPTARVLVALTFR
jgi:hypothetical protein